MGNRKFDTDVIHHGYDAKSMLGSLSVPIYQTSSFEFDSAEAGAQLFNGEGNGYIYSRLGNPTVQVLEERIAILEGGERGLAFGSGMGAISAVLMGLTKTGDHILCSNGLYGNTFSMLKMLEEKYHVSVSNSNFTTETEIRNAILEETTVIYVETPVNPTMEIVDLKMVAKVAKEYGITVVVDNTFSSPYLQRPIELGCDLVVHSATKYLNGHGDVVGGLAVGSRSILDKIEQTTHKSVGAIMSPFDAWLLLRGLKTLSLRMERHCDNAVFISERLKEHDQVSAVHYPGVGVTVDREQMSRGGGVIAFDIKGSVEDVYTLMNQLKMIKVAVSLGDTETLIQHPATMTHKVIPEREQRKMGITSTLIRLSVGIEAKEDIWDDLRQGLAAISK